MNTETIFFPFRSDAVEAHSWVTLEGVRFCFGVLASCQHCVARLQEKK